ncbi:hypothetical protein [Solirubrobacter soli]|uniref:hypothetical protein n=1 Tax=Solirubrobacter soli TaxID=363832 RepID=UPI000400CFD8|nr:hypothetical protein [Solirubrobacter soli]
MHPRLRTRLSLAALALSCFAPWASATTFAQQTLTLGALNETMYGARYLLVLVAGAGLGLAVRNAALTMTCGLLALLLSLYMAYEAPGTMLQFGHEAHLTWGAYLAVASSLAFVLFIRRDQVAYVSAVGVIDR